MRAGHVTAVLALCLILSTAYIQAACLPAATQNVFFKPTVSGTWAALPTNWRVPGGPPPPTPVADGGDTALINFSTESAARTVTVATTVAARQLTLGASPAPTHTSTLKTVTVNSGGSLTLAKTGASNCGVSDAIIYPGEWVLLALS